MSRRALCLAWFVLSCSLAGAAHAQPMTASEPDADVSGAPAPQASESRPERLPALGGVDAKGLEGALERAAALPSDEFCRKRPAFLSHKAQKLCPLADAAARRCPAFREACQGVLTASPDSRPSGVLDVIARIVGAIGYLLLFGLLLVAAFGLVVLIRRLLKEGRSPAPDSEQLAAPAEAPKSPENLVDRDMQRRMARAHELAAQGAYPQALAELYAAVVFALDARGLIEARKGRTNGDYARELAARPELSAAFRDVARTVESVQFGARIADRSLFERSLERSTSLVSTGLGALALVLALSVAGCDRGSPTAGSTAAACGTSANGYSFLCSALEKSHDARRRHRALEALDEDVGVLVVLSSELSESDQEAVVAWVDEGGVAVLSERFTAFDHVLKLTRHGPPCTGEFALDGASATAPGLVVAPEPTLQSTALKVYAGCGNAVLAGRAAFGAGSVVLLSSPSLLSNASLAAGSNAELLLPLIPRDHGPLEIVGDWTGHSADSPFASLKAAGLLPWLAHLTLLAFAFARYRGTPFARRHQLAEDPRRKFVEHVEALGARWADAGASRVALAAYAAWGLELLRGRTSGIAQGNLSDLAEALSSRAKSPPDAVLRTLVKARLAQDGDEGASEAEHLDTLRELSRLISETGGSRWT
jgi:hypothetical protein